MTCPCCGREPRGPVPAVPGDLCPVCGEALVPSCGECGGPAYPRKSGGYESRCGWCLMDKYL